MKPPSDHPYRSQPAKAFWKKSVADRHPLDITDWYQRKFPIDDAAVATAGSCFAQYIGRQFRQRGFNYLDAEPAPGFLSAASAREFGYDLFSARYGNVYTTRQLVQLFDRAFGTFVPKEGSWSRDGGYVDPFRPTIEPEPFATIDELVASRAHHLACVRTLFETAKVFVFTLGLTETWLSREDGAAYPICPGVSGGHFDSARHRLANLGFAEVRSDLEAFVARVRNVNPGMRFIFTVSPVPLAATATGRHVIVATTYSKSVLRAAAGYMEARDERIDYFPAYEIVSCHPMRGSFFEPDLRNVSQHGVSHVMAQFFTQHRPVRARIAAATHNEEDRDPEDVVCDEAILAGFGDTP